nr:hypothetical protein [Escherichia coli]
MKITDHKLPEGIALTFRVPEGNIKHPLILLCHGFCGSVNPPEQGRALYDAVASGTKELYEEADACHYDIYKGAFFERVAAVQTQWFKKHL